MDNRVFPSLTFVNAKGVQTVLVEKNLKTFFEIRGRSGFTAPDVELITQKYFDGTTKVLKRQVQPRTVAVNMIAVGKSEAHRDDLFFKMISQLMDISGGEIGKLYVTRSDGLVVYLNCAYSSGLNVTEDYRRFQQFTLEFYAADPYFYWDLDDAEILLGADSKITLRDKLMLGQGHTLGEIIGDGHGFIENNGTETILPVIKATRINGSFTIENITTGQILTLNNIVTEENETLVIDTRGATKSIKIIDANGSERAAGQYLDWSNINMEFEIAPGKNEIVFSSSIGSYTEGITLEMSQRYLSA